MPNESNQNCFFCGLINSDSTFLVEESKHFKAILDINPSVIGQCIIISKEHYPFLPALSIEVLEDLIELLNKLRAKYLTMGYEDYNLLINNGTGAGQKVLHFSANFFPRSKNDGFNSLRFEFLNINSEQLETQVKSFKEMFSQIQSSQIPSNSIDSKKNEFTPKNILIDSENYTVFLDEKQYTPGHVKILAKYLDFSIKSKKELATILKLVPIFIFEGLKPTGTNVIFDFFGNNLLIHVLPRFDNDIEFNFPKKEYDFKEFLKQINEKEPISLENISNSKKREKEKETNNSKVKKEIDNEDFNKTPPDSFKEKKEESNSNLISKESNKDNNNSNNNTSDEVNEKLTDPKLKHYLNKRL